jgi:hypothetical protein
VIFIRREKRTGIFEVLFRNADRADNMGLLILLFCPCIDQNEILLFIQHLLELLGGDDRIFRLTGCGSHNNQC